MILIISNSKFESTTDLVCDWLLSLKASFFRLNIDELFSSLYEITYDVNKDLLIIKYIPTSYIIDFSKISVVWARKKTHKIFDDIIDKSFNSKSYNQINFARFLSMERNTILKILLRKIKRVKWIDHFDITNNLNKIEVLQVAQKVGLEIPNTIVTNNMSMLPSCNLISKPIYEATGFIENNGSYITHTQKVDSGTELKIDISLFQTEISKKYELRVFYLDGIFFTMAIFSANNEKTKTDFRIYDFKKPNRMVPYKLPEKIENKIRILMNDLELKHGSIDMIYNENKEYVFLEVNPIGQFGMVSYPCRYFIEKKIAEYLKMKSEYV